MGSPRHVPDPRLRLLGAIASLLLASGPTVATAEPMLDLNQRALAWTAGDYIAPLVCEFPHGVKRGVRKVRVTRGPRHLRPPAARLSFPGMELPPGTTCTNDTGTAQPNVTGSLLYQLEAISRPDIADHEFTEALERNGGFTFTIREGVLEISGEKVDFKGGQASFHQIVPGSDAFRRLQDIPGLRKLGLTVTAPDGTELLLDLAQGPPSRRPR
ncbi:MAG: hypothetical protein ACR2PQ_01725 [Myxococcota bacterium]